jgi:hypothetical protein
MELTWFCCCIDSSNPTEPILSIELLFILLIFDYIIINNLKY